ncbi:MAG: hypothetical protein LBQ05_02970 [Christensenellaceae bacterium]|jgi:hypothetical protein|nr:hypothetical protein [Christensenellaceae bacterium]
MDEGTEDGDSGGMSAFMKEVVYGDQATGQDVDCRGDMSLYDDAETSTTTDNDADVTFDGDESGEDDDEEDDDEEDDDYDSDDDEDEDDDYDNDDGDSPKKKGKGKKGQPTTTMGTAQAATTHTQSINAGGGGGGLDTRKLPDDIWEWFKGNWKEIPAKIRKQINEAIKFIKKGMAQFSGGISTVIWEGLKGFDFAINKIPNVTDDFEFILNDAFTTAILKPAVNQAFSTVKVFTDLFMLAKEMVDKVKKVSGKVNSGVNKIKGMAKKPA